MCALKAAGKIRLPPALLTPRFKKLVATKQAQENRLAPHPHRDHHPATPGSPAPATETPSPPPVAANRGDGGCQLAGPEDAEWATMAEEEQGRESGLGIDGGDAGSGSAGGIGGSGGVGDGDGERGSAAGAEREHLILLCRALVACSASGTDRIRKRAALLLADADIPGAVDALQVRGCSSRLFLALVALEFVCAACFITFSYCSSCLR